MGIQIRNSKIDHSEVAALVEKLRDDFLCFPILMGEYSASSPKVVMAAIAEIRKEDPEVRLEFSVQDRKQSTFSIWDPAELAANKAEWSVPFALPPRPIND